MAKKELGKIGKGMKQTTLFDFNSPKTHSENSKKFTQTKLTDFLRPLKKVKALNRKDFIVINEEAWKTKVIENKTERIFNGDHLADFEMIHSSIFEEDFEEESAETKELKTDFAFKMLEICLGNLLEEEKAKKVETETETIETIEIEEAEIEVSEGMKDWLVSEIQPMETETPMEKETENLMVKFISSMMNVTLGEMLKEKEVEKIETPKANIERIEIEEDQTLNLEEVKRFLLILIFCLYCYLLSITERKFHIKKETNIENPILKAQILRPKCNFYHKINKCDFIEII